MPTVPVTLSSVNFHGGCVHIPKEWMPLEDWKSWAYREAASGSTIGNICDCLYGMC